MNSCKHINFLSIPTATALSHRARGRAADGLRTQAWPLRESRRDHDAGRLSPRSAGIGGLRPSMEQIELSEGRLQVHRVKNGIPSVHPIRGDEIRALRKLRRDYLKDAYVFVSE